VRVQAPISLYFLSNMQMKVGMILTTERRGDFRSGRFAERCDIWSDMNVLISWSGARSRSIAALLRQGMEACPGVRGWMSEIDIPTGSHWSQTLSKELDDAQFGIVCVTPENVNSAWLLYEAGVMSRHVRDARVVPYLIGLRPEELTGPLTLFQSVRANKEGTRRLFNELELACGVSVPKDHGFKFTWPLIANALFWRECDFSGRKVLRLPQQVIDANNDLEHTPGWLLAALPAVYTLNFDFEDAYREGEVVLYARKPRETGAACGMSEENRRWDRIASCRNHTDARTQLLPFAEDVLLFVAGFLKEGAPNPFLVWRASDPLDASYHDRVLTLTFDGGNHVAISGERAAASNWLGDRQLL